MLKHKIWAEIDTDALVHNYEVLTEHIRKNTPDCTVMCIVKADCYGHGAEICVPRLVEAGARDFGVSCLEEAIEIRKYARDASILILGYTPSENVSLLIRYGVTQTVYSYEYAKSLADALARAKADGEVDEDAVLRCHVKIDTGMNRIGFCASESECIDEIKRAAELRGLSMVGAFTHFACAEETEGETKDMSVRQAESFFSVINALKNDSVSFETVHLCNSAASVRYPEYNFDMVRAGIMLYGHSPFETGRYDIGLKPVMRFVTAITHIHTLKAGETVSYGARFTAARDMTLATVAAGYADGFLRVLGEGGMYVHGKYAKIVGRVCMDQCMLDITDIDGVRVGDEAEIFDADGKNITALAKAANTISYELLCSVSKRVNRIEVRNAKK